MPRNITNTAPSDDQSVDVFTVYLNYNVQGSTKNGTLANVVTKVPKISYDSNDTLKV